MQVTDVLDVLDVTDVTKHLTKNQILEERDFQAMYGLARDVDRVRGGLRVVILAVRAAQKHPDPENLDLLAEAVAMLGDLPELPTRNSSRCRVCQSRYLTRIEQFVSDAPYD